MIGKTDLYAAAANYGSFVGDGSSDSVWRGSSIKVQEDHAKS